MSLSGISAQIVADFFSLSAKGARSALQGPFIFGRVFGLGLTERPPPRPRLGARNFSAAARRLQRFTLVAERRGRASGPEGPDGGGAIGSGAVGAGGA